jgi:hypothetical protein
MKNVKKMAQEMVGDGKIPNKYFVSIHDDYLYYDKETDCWESASERDGRESQGKTLAAFSTYAGARKLFESIPLGELYKGILVRGKTIEDRLSGELTDETLREVISFESEEGERLDYTKGEMGRRGEIFK